jgi:hypothetical protein
MRPRWGLMLKSRGGERCECRVRGGGVQTKGLGNMDGCEWSSGKGSYGISPVRLRYHLTNFSPLASNCRHGLHRCALAIMQLSLSTPLFLSQAFALLAVYLS